MTANEYQSQAARDARDMNYGDTSYWQYLDDAARETRDYYLCHGDPDTAARMMTRTLTESLAGNTRDIGVWSYD